MPAPAGVFEKESQMKKARYYRHGAGRSSLTGSRKTVRPCLWGDFAANRSRQIPLPSVVSTMIWPGLIYAITFPTMVSSSDIVNVSWIDVCVRQVFVGIHDGVLYFFSILGGAGSADAVRIAKGVPV